MASPIDRLLESLIREEEALNHRYQESAKQVENPAVAASLQEFHKQGYDRIQRLYGLWKSVQETKP